MIDDKHIDAVGFIVPSKGKTKLNLVFGLKKKLVRLIKVWWVAEATGLINFRIQYRFITGH